MEQDEEECNGVVVLVVVDVVVVSTLELCCTLRCKLTKTSDVSVKVMEVTNPEAIKTCPTNPHPAPTSNV